MLTAVPVLGFERLVFLEGPSEELPTASTCDLILRVPTAHGDNYGALKDWMELSILGTVGLEQCKIPLYTIFA